MKSYTMSLTEAMHGADFVQLNGIVFATEYLRVPDESTVADDVVMELRLGDTELAFTRGELDDARISATAPTGLRPACCCGF